jgi:hypothetical protein
MIAASPPDRPRRRVCIGALVLAAVVLLSVGGYLIFGRGSSRSPSSVVTSYLRALARGDARTALSLGRKPADRTLLTAAVLHQQQTLGPITAIKVVGSDTGDYGAIVHVRYRVGNSTIDDHFEVIPKGSGWTLAHTAVDVLVTGAGDLRSPTVFGQSIGTRTEVYAFPGVITFGSMDPAFALSPASAVFTNPDVATIASPQAVLSSEGSAAATSEVRAAMILCAHDRSLAPAHCPQRGAQPTVAGLVANSLQWQAPTDYSGLSFRVDQRESTTVHVTGKLAWKLAYRVRPAHAEHDRLRSVDVSSDLAGTVNFDTEPPVYRAA